MKHNLLLRYNKDLLYFFKSRLTANKFPGFVFAVFIGLIIIYYLLFSQHEIEGPVVIINNNNNISISRTKNKSLFI